MVKHFLPSYCVHMWLLDCGPTSALQLQAQHCTLFHMPKYLHVRYTAVHIKGQNQLVSLHLATVTTNKE